MRTPNSWANASHPPRKRFGHFIASPVSRWLDRIEKRLGPACDAGIDLPYIITMSRGIGNRFKDKEGNDGPRNSTCLVMVSGKTHDRPRANKRFRPVIKSANHDK